MQTHGIIRSLLRSSGQLAFYGRNFASIFDSCESEIVRRVAA
jgi:hypothetical protein